MALTSEQLKEYLPHRDPMVMLDVVSGWDLTERRLWAEKTFSSDGWYFRGHFPSFAILPGVLILEGLAQCAYVLVQLMLNHPLPEDSIPLLGDAHIKILRPTFPNTVLKFEIKAVKLSLVGNPMGLFVGSARSGSNEVARASLAMVGRPATELSQVDAAA